MSVHLKKYVSTIKTTTIIKVIYRSKYVSAFE